MYLYYYVIGLLKLERHMLVYLVLNIYFLNVTVMENISLKAITLEN